ncbi:MAG: hypothetical protein KAI66_14030 [Lentisphaeria bacterium]|nr:hypothetical protein [Lentisphaeria bacterium]
MSNPTGKVRALEQKVQDLVQVVEREEGLVAGSLYAARTRCGRQACKCMASDYRHVNRCLSFTQQGKSRTRTIPAAMAEDIQAKTGAYRHAKTIRRLIARIAAELLKDIDSIIARAAHDGQRKMLATLLEARKGKK